MRLPSFLSRCAEMCRAKLLPIAMLLLILTLQACAVWSVTESTDHGSYYFRMKADYSHDGQPINFDIVVACSIRVSRSRGGDSGFLATRYPRFFVKRTHDDHPVMQIVPSACRGETTKNGQIPSDFLPGIIWFDKLGDYRFGIAYVSEDGFESSNSRLKFHGANIQRASRADWDAFRKRAAENEGMKKRYYDRPFYWTEDAKRIAAGGGNEIEAAYVRGCSGVRRYKLSAAGRAVVRRFWSADRPKYWAMDSRDDGPWPELQRLEKSAAIFENGIPYGNHFVGFSYEYAGFPTRARGGMKYSATYRLAAPEFFPVRNDRAIPWVFSEEVDQSKYLTKSVEVHSGAGKGFLYCYTTLNPGEGKLEVPLPNYRERESRVRVDGEWVTTPSPRRWSWPSPFYEKDTHINFFTEIGLS